MAYFIRLELKILYITSFLVPECLVPGTQVNISLIILDCPKSHVSLVALSYK